MSRARRSMGPPFGIVASGRLQPRDAHAPPADASRRTPSTAGSGVSVDALSSYSLTSARDQRGGGGMPRGEGVRLELVPARVQRRQRPQHEREHRQREEEQDRARRRAGPATPARRGPRRTTAAAASHARSARNASDHAADHSHALQHVLQLEVTELVREHRLDLVRREALEQRVEEHDALRAAEAGEVRVAVARAPRAVHHEQAACSRNRSAPAAPRSRRAPRPSGSGENLLKSGAITVGIEHQHQELERRSTRAHAHSHHNGPAARISHSTSAASGSPSTTATATPFARSASHSARVVRLKPNRSSMPNVCRTRTAG